MFLSSWKLAGDNMYEQWLSEQHRKLNFISSRCKCQTV